MSLIFLSSIFLLFCNKKEKQENVSQFGHDITFLKKHTDVIVLEAPDSPGRVAIIPGMQARIMTSSAEGEKGLSFGWINRKLIASGERQKHINAFGGEDRFWLGPEGGQFSIFFKHGDPFDIEHWQTPEPIDWGPWDLIEKSRQKAVFRKTFSLVNYSNFQFDVLAERTIRVLPKKEIEKVLGVQLNTSTKYVGFESDNRITNNGNQSWEKSTGLLSIWILGMFNPSPLTTVVIPFKPGPLNTLGPIVNDQYFGEVPWNRLKIDKTTNNIYFKADGQYRSKIGISPTRAKNILGSYDAQRGVLTLVRFSLDENAIDYVNSMWEIQDDPYAGDVANSYNDGPPEPGKPPMGPFYELESSSAAAALQPGETLSHIHQTFHFIGPREALNQIALKTLQVDLDKIASAFN